MTESPTHAARRKLWLFLAPIGLVLLLVFGSTLWLLLATSSAWERNPARQAAWQALQQCRIDVAIQSFLQMTEQYPNQPALWADLGKALNYAGEYNQAVIAYDRALALQEQNPEHWYGRGSSLRSLGKYAEAQADFQQALELKPQEARYLLALGVNWYWQGKYPQAIVDLSRAIEADPGQGRAWGYLGLCWWQRREPNQARESFKRAVALLKQQQGSDPALQAVRGFFRCFVGELEGGLHELDTVTHNCPEYPLGWFYRGLAYLNFAPPKQAITEMEKVLELAPENAQALQILKLAQEKFSDQSGPSRVPTQEPQPNPPPEQSSAVQ